MQNDEKRIAVFIDFENVAMGVRESKYGNFDIELVLKRLVEKGKIMVKRAYSDWHRYAEFKRAFHQAAIELIDVPQTRYSGKNSADIRIVVDALDLSYQKEHIDTFVLVSGDSDFSPLVSKLRENGRYVIGMGVKKSSSDLLVNNCDEFVYYEDLVRPVTTSPAFDPKLQHLPAKRAEAIRLVLETFDALQREGKETIYGSMIKQTLIRKLPSFNETYYGYPTFSRLLEDAAENKLLKLTKDQKSGGYIVTSVTEATEVVGSAASASSEAAQEILTTTGVSPVNVGRGASRAPIDGRDQRRHSRWGRNRWNRSVQRGGETPQVAQELPSQPESGPPEVAGLTSPVNVSPVEVGEAPSGKEVVAQAKVESIAGPAASEPAAENVVEAGPTVPLESTPAQVELKGSEHNFQRKGRGRPPRALKSSQGSQNVRTSPAQQTANLFESTPASVAAAEWTEESASKTSSPAAELQPKGSGHTVRPKGHSTKRTPRRTRNK
jgi:uncharacterized protein (TIGR00288 family)